MYCFPEGKRNSKPHLRKMHDMGNEVKQEIIAPRKLRRKAGNARQVLSMLMPTLNCRCYPTPTCFVFDPCLGLGFKEGDEVGDARVLYNGWDAPNHARICCS